jgi:hypothetical protein
MKVALKSCLAIAIVVVAFLGVIELRHKLRFGHFVGPGLHADFMVARVDLGIPGITKAYDATLTNFGPFPRNVSRCEYLTDAMAHESELAFSVQRWESSSQNWTTPLVPSKAFFCKPYPLGIVEGKVVERRLWPGQNLSIGEDATAAMFQKGDIVRFVLFAAEPWTVASGYPTAGFEIDEQVSTATPLRVRH